MGTNSSKASASTAHAAVSEAPTTDPPAAAAEEAPKTTTTEATQSAMESGSSVAKEVHMSEAARGYAAAVEHDYPEIQKLEEQLKMLEQQIKNLGVPPACDPTSKTNTMTNQE